jgi:hypothetical protein
MARRGCRESLAVPGEASHLRANTVSCLRERSKKMKATKFHPSTIVLAVVLGLCLVTGASAQLTLPYSGSYSGSGVAFKVTDSSAGNAGWFEITNASNATTALVGITSGTGRGLYGLTLLGDHGVYGESRKSGGAGVWGLANTGAAATGVYGVSQNGRGVVGVSYNGEAGVKGKCNKTDGVGVWGIADTGTSSKGVYGQSASGAGVYGASTNGDGVIGSANTALRSGVYGFNNAAGGYGVAGGSAYGVGVSGSSLNGDGVAGKSTVLGKSGVYGSNDAVGGYGVTGRSTAGTAVCGIGTTGIGVYGSSDTGRAAKFEITNSVSTADVLYVRTTGSGTGVYSMSTSGGAGYFQTLSGASPALAAITNGTGGALYGSSSGSGAAVFGYQASTGRAGDFRISNASSSADALYATTNGTGYAVHGVTTGSGAGVEGINSNSGNWCDLGLPSCAAYAYGASGNADGIRAEASNGANAWAVHGISSSGYAGYFSGKVNVTGQLTKGSGAFKIDHPLDPENKYLYHSFVESPDMMNVYNGNVVLDANGEAVVQLADWFEALNKDFRYQLTCIAGFAPVYVAEEISGNCFRIAGGSAGLKVSWQVTGIRQDAYANAHRIPVEEDKPADEQGTYLHPEDFGQPTTMSLDAAREAEKGELHR